MEFVVVSDTNILIDLVETGLLEQFFRLPYEFHMTDMVISELTDEKQRALVEHFVKERKLKVKSFSPDEMLQFLDFIRTRNKGNKLHYTDLSVWYYASANDFVLLTGDGKLRKMASADGVEVHGIFFIYDRLVEMDIIPKDVASERLELLKIKNPRLPMAEIEKRIEDWAKDNKGKEDYDEG